MEDRRAFLRGLVSLPLIGGSVALIGQPVAVAEPVTVDLLSAYKTWLHFEQKAVSWELADHPEMIARYGSTRGGRFRLCQGRHDFVGQSGDFHDFSDPLRSASTRAALVLSTVGCDWMFA